MYTKTQEEPRSVVCVQQMVNPYRASYNLPLPAVKSIQSVQEPTDWFDAQRQAIIAADRIPQLFSLPYLFRKGVIFFWSHPSAVALLSCLINRHIIYLCWGLPRQSNSVISYYLKTWKLRLILKSSNLVLVNDEKTFEKLKALGLKNVKILPYIVDTDFFKFSSNDHRQDFFLIPGDNDRDELFISSLASFLSSASLPRKLLPSKIVRVTRAQNVVDFYSRNPNSAVEVQYNISFAHLLHLYQTACGVLLPLKTQDHAAGQTSILEALACGAFVLISQGKTSSIVNRYDSVTEVPENELTLWHEAIGKMIMLIRQNPKILEKTAGQIKNVHHPSIVSQQLASIFSTVGNSS